jgi:hypothetical protein
VGNAVAEEAGSGIKNLLQQGTSQQQQQLLM